jgi:triacylglycerol esterase/lipase EstA (alpha/beta hydrolase family)
MLAQLLRRLILGQVLLGAAVGYWLASSNAWPLWTLLVPAVFLPFAILIIVDIASGLLSMAPGEPTSMWWRSLFGEFRAGIQIFLFRQPWTWDAPALLPATSNAGKVPVVLVHGYLCNHRIWEDITKALRANGHAVFAVNLEPVFTPIDAYAPVIESAVQSLMRHTGQSKVALVGHSMGGLAIRAWMRSNGTERVARVLTLGTPHAGTKLAKGTPTPNGKQMLWKSQWLTHLTAGESAATWSLIRIAITPQDNIVCPQRPQVLPGITPVVFEGIGHLQMCTHQPLIEWVVDELG